MNIVNSRITQDFKMKKKFNMWNIVLFIVLATGTFLAIRFTEQFTIHSLLADIGVSIVDAIIVGFMVGIIIKKTRR